MRFILFVSGADSAAVLPVPDQSVMEKYDSLQDALDKRWEWVDKWLGEGYHLTPAGIYVKDGLWRISFVVDRENPGAIYK